MLLRRYRSRVNSLRQKSRLLRGMCWRSTDHYNDSIHPNNRREGREFKAAIAHSLLCTGVVLKRFDPCRGERPTLEKLDFGNRFLVLSLRISTWSFQHSQDTGRRLSEISFMRNFHSVVRSSAPGSNSAVLEARFFNPRIFSSPS